jgi:branched-chain amino acid transport system permease protein
MRPARVISLSRQVRPAWWGVLVIAAITAGFTGTQSSYSLYTFNLCLLACLGAIALNLLMGTAGQVSIGNAAFLAVGGFASVWLLRLGLPFPADVIVAGVIAGLAGVVVGLPALRLSGLILSLATLAAYFIVLFVATEYQSDASNAGSGGFAVIPLFSSQGITGAQQDWAWLLMILLGLTILVVSRLMRERCGRACRVIRDHPLVAPTLGINVARYKLGLFAFTSAIIGLQGGLTAYLTGLVSTDNYTFLLAVQYLAMILIGGTDSIVGAVLGASLIIALPTLIPNVITPLFGPTVAGLHGPQISQAIYGILIIIFVTSSPGGIVGWGRAASNRICGKSALRASAPVGTAEAVTSGTKGP